MAVKRVRRRLRVHARSSASPFYCFHDRDVAPEGKNLDETNANLDAVVKALKEEQQRTGIKLLWGTANLFSNPRFVHGAATSCNADVFAYAARPGEEGLEVTKELGGENYVFWGGREGYTNLYNTDLKRELDHLAKFFHMAVDYKKKIGFTRPVPDRAEAEGADRRTSTTSTPPRASPSCAATAWTSTSSSTSRPTTPRWPATR